jgi:hypothetical protein
MVSSRFRDSSKLQPLFDLIVLYLVNAPAPTEKFVDAEPGQQIGDRIYDFGVQGSDGDVPNVQPVELVALVNHQDELSDPKGVCFFY